MIPFLIYKLIKKFINHHRSGKGLSISKYLRTCLLIIFFGLLALFIVLIPAISKAQNLQLNYKIVQGGDHVGWMRIERIISGNKSTLLLVSEVKTRILIMIMVSVKESSTFENGRLICSAQYRKANGNIKVDKQMRFVDGQYQLVEKGEKETLVIPLIGANLLSLYFQEPFDISTVYCDTYRVFIPIIKTTDGGYKVQLPDGNSNSFYYRDGICTKIKISTTFYTATVILNP